jgi:hypothetical protein
VDRGVHGPTPRAACARTVINRLAASFPLRHRLPRSSRST